MNIDKYRKAALPIIVAAYENDHDDDTLKMNLMGAGVPFSKLNMVAKTIAIEENLLVDPKIVTDALAERIPTVTWADVKDSWDDFSGMVTKLADSVEGATFKRTIALVRAYAKNDLDLSMPGKPRGGFTVARVGVIAEVVTGLFAANPQPTKQEFYDAVYPNVKGEKKHDSCMYYMGLYLSIGSTLMGEDDIETTVKRLAEEANPTAPSADVADIAEPEYETEEDDDDME